MFKLRSLFKWKKTVVDVVVDATVRPNMLILDFIGGVAASPITKVRVLVSIGGERSDFQRHVTNVGILTYSYHLPRTKSVTMLNTLITAIRDSASENRNGALIPMLMCLNEDVSAITPKSREWRVREWQNINNQLTDWVTAQ